MASHDLEIGSRSIAVVIDAVLLQGKAAAPPNQKRSMFLNDAMPDDMALLLGHEPINLDIEITNAFISKTMRDGM